ncbi:MAG: helix-turn-helix transcriptional regulator [bacterium]
MKKEKNQKEKSFDEHLDTKYGKTGTKIRKNFDKEFQSLKFGLIIKEARVFRNLTQDELAQKSGTTKSYISRIEHNASDIRLSTLNRILYEGLGVKLKFAIDF